MYCTCWYGLDFFGGGIFKATLFGVLLTGVKENTVAARSPETIACIGKQITVVNGIDIRNGTLVDLKEALNSAVDALTLELEQNESLGKVSSDLKK